MNPPEVIAHRSMTSIYGSNNIESMELLYLSGVRNFEVDLSVSREGHPVVRNPRDMPAGVRTHSLPDFESVARWSKSRDAAIFVDIKYHSKAPIILQKALDVVEEYGISALVTIVSYDVEPLQEARCRSRVKVGHIVNLYDPSRIYPKADLWIIPFDDARSNSSNLPWNKVIVSKVDSAPRYHMATRWGAPFVMSDCPLVLQSVRYRRYFERIGSGKRMLHQMMKLTSALESRPTRLLSVKAANGPKRSDVRHLILELHGHNSELWCLEEKVRMNKLPKAEVADIKKMIDKHNRLRCHTGEEIDRCFVSLQDQCVRLNPLDSSGTTSMGSLIDKLSILSLKIHYLRRLRDGPKPLPEVRSVCRVMLAVLERERALTESAIRAALERLTEGKAPLSVHLSLKTYDDQVIGPPLRMMLATGSRRRKASTRTGSAS